MTRAELMERLALHASRISEGTTRTLTALDQAEGALCDTLDAYKAAAHYFRSKSPHDAHAFEQGACRTEAAKDVLRAIRESIVEKSQRDLDRHYGVSA